MRSPPGLLSWHRFAQNEIFMAQLSLKKVIAELTLTTNFFGVKRGKQKSSITQMESNV